jgi:hypothetical protein
MMNFAYAVKLAAAYRLGRALALTSGGGGMLGALSGGLAGGLSPESIGTRSHGEGALRGLVAGGIMGGLGGGAAYAAGRLVPPTRPNLRSAVELLGGGAGIGLGALGVFSGRDWNRRGIPPDPEITRMEIEEDARQMEARRLGVGPQYEELVMQGKAPEALSLLRRFKP